MTTYEPIWLTGDHTPGNPNNPAYAEHFGWTYLPCPNEPDTCVNWSHWAFDQPIPANSAPSSPVHYADKQIKIKAARREAAASEPRGYYTPKAPKATKADPNAARDAAIIADYKLLGNKSALATKYDLHRNSIGNILRKAGL